MITWDRQKNRHSIVICTVGTPTWRFFCQYPRNEAKQKGRLDAHPNDEGDKLEARSSAAIRVAAALFSFGAFRVGIFAN